MSYARIKDAIQSRHALIVAGAGVTMASVSRDEISQTSWKGLLESGIQYVKENVDADSAQWEQWVRGDLEQTQDVANALIMAAQKIQNKLSGGHYRAWLRQSVGALTAHDNRLIRSIEKLNVPIATTNYDQLIEQVLSRQSTDWCDPVGMQAALQLRSDDVMHLHGVWNNPDSVIFSSESYGKIVADKSAQLIQEAAGTATTFIFLGAGSTVDDPNLGQLMNWIQNKLPGSDSFHYLLCLNGDLASLQKRYHGTCVQPTAYGSSHADLNGYLARLATDCWGSETTAEVLKLNVTSLNAMADRVKGEVITSSHSNAKENLGVDDLLIPPVLLPAAHEDIIQSAEEGMTGQRIRCDVRSDARNLSGMVIIGEETSGLTSALEWLVHERARASVDLIPVIVDFVSFGKGVKPLQRAIRRELNDMEISIAPGDELPKLVVAIDNVVSTPNISSEVHRQFERLVSDLGENFVDSFVLGCRPGAEFDILERLEAADLRAKSRYIGHVTFSDAKRLAKLVAPARAAELADRAFSIISRECLSRTPMTMALLLDVLLRGEVTLATASDTALLDAYVSLLLGRGNPYDDARFSLDSKEREAILATLAERFVREQAGSISQSDTISTFESMFDEVGWDDVPTEVLENLKSRHILAYSRGQVKFTQTSFLHLFAAKRATESESFKEFLLSNPLYYAPIISHYAALTRSDVDVLKQVGKLVRGGVELSSENAPIFSEYDENNSILQSDDLEEFAKALDPKSSSGKEDQPQVVESERDEEETDEYYYDTLSPIRERAPYPANNMEDAPPLMKSIAALALVSNVLRDSELVRNVELKTAILRDTLAVWGKLVHILDTDESIQATALEMAEDLANEFEIRESKREEFVFSLSSTLGIFIGSGSMVSNLASRKLLKALDGCFVDPAFLEDVGATVMGALLSYETGASDWPAKFLEAQKNYGGVLAVHMLMWKYAMRKYYYDRALKREAVSDLEEFMCEREIRRLRLTQVSEVSAKRTELLGKMRRSRALALAEASARQKIEEKRSQVTIE